MSQLNTELSFLREQLLVKKTSETLNTEVENLLARVATLKEENAKLQELLESVRAEGADLRRDLEQSEREVSSKREP